MGGGSGGICRESIILNYAKSFMKGFLTISLPADAQRRRVAEDGVMRQYDHMIKKMKIAYFGIILWFELTGVSAGQNNACFLMAPGGTPCHLTINGSDYHISPDGVMLLNIIKQKRLEVKIVLPDNFFIEAVQYQLINKIIMFTFEMTDGESGSTLIAMFDLILPRFDGHVEKVV